MSVRTEELKPINKPFVRIMSRLRNQPILRDGEHEFFSTFYIRQYPFNPDDIYHEIKAGEQGRLDLLSYHYYQTPLLWWIIAEANDIFHPMRDTVPGTVIRIPAPDWIYSNIVR
jgi:hypothetical protein